MRLSFILTTIVSITMYSCTNVDSESSVENLYVEFRETEDGEEEIISDEFGNILSMYVRYHSGNYDSVDLYESGNVHRGVFGRYEGDLLSRKLIQKQDDKAGTLIHKSEFLEGKEIYSLDFQDGKLISQRRLPILELFDSDENYVVFRTLGPFDFKHIGDSSTYFSQMNVSFFDAEKHEVLYKYYTRNILAALDTLHLTERETSDLESRCTRFVYSINVNDTSGVKSYFVSEGKFDF